MDAVRYLLIDHFKEILNTIFIEKKKRNTKIHKKKSTIFFNKIFYKLILVEC